jgi:NitT/TauT family transport system substrate-binding protein
MTVRLSRGRWLAGLAGLAVARRPAAAQTLEKLRIAGVPTDDMTPIFYAIKAGLYQRVGLDLEVVPTSSGTVATTAVIAGTYELGKGSLIAALDAHVRGLPLVIVANSIVHAKDPYSLVLVAADSTSKSGADLNGKIGGTPALNDINQLAIDAWVDKNGGDSKTIKWVEVPNSVAAVALADHRIDVCGLQEPLATSALEGGKVRELTVNYNAIAEHFVFGGYLANAGWASAHADIVKRFVRATYEAGAYTNGHHEETAAMMSDITKIPLPVFRKISRAIAATTSDPALLQPLIDAAAKYNQIPHPFPAKEIYFNNG